jgi:1-acyl-sn-glycerol-3-phosphate acyltransferase
VTIGRQRLVLGVQTELGFHFRLNAQHFSPYRYPPAILPNVRAKRSTWYSFARWTTRNFFYKLICGGLKSVGEPNIPETGGVIIAPNHLSHVDPPAFACTMERQLTFMAKEELFRGLGGKLIRSLGAYSVKRGEGDKESIRKSIEFLQEGKVLLVFPEGTRGDGKTLLPINPGVALLAKKTGSPVVPAGIIGSQIVMPRGGKGIHRHAITVAYGEPLTYESIAIHETEKLNREAFTKELARRIVKLCRDNGLPLEVSVDQ